LTPKLALITFNPGHIAVVVILLDEMLHQLLFSLPIAGDVVTVSSLPTAFSFLNLIKRIKIFILSELLSREILVTLYVPSQ
jgi:hypothetical protein